MTALADLIARLEAAPGPDRRLDGDIWRAVSGWAMADGAIFSVPCAGLVWHRRDVFRADAFKEPPHYTSSLDAALTLVPETKPGARWWSLSVGWSGVARGEVRVYPEAPHLGRTREGLGDHRVPAIALCIAALKARATP